MTPTITYFVLTFLICTSLGITGLMLIDRSRRMRRARLVRFSTDHPAKSSVRVMRRLEAVQAKETNGLRRDRNGILGVLEQRLREAGLEMAPTGAVGLIALISISVCLALWSTGLLLLPLALAVGAGSGWVGFGILLDGLRARRVRAFNEALPDCLDILARGLRAGQPIPAALTVVAQNSKGIAQDEFRRCCEELKLGVPLVPALTGMAERIGSPEARFVTVATSLQSETGGNLVETLENLAELLREKRKLRKKAAALTAEIRVSAVILTSLPFVVALALFVMNRTYLTPLIADPRGHVMVAVALASLCMGVFSMYRLSRLDV
ncbi:type II secretion system F family protein [Sulfitobacter sp. 1A10445]|uniref:type II secretion system F family protein n=1 Tax=unclassified Sulfitobacter TaxID=196795 RepID=UPI0037459A07